MEIPDPDGNERRIREGLEYELEDAQEDPRDLKDVQHSALRLMGLRCYIDPTANKVETWEATVQAMQAATAIFQIANATEGDVEFRVGNKTLTAPAGATKGIADAGNWVTAYYLAIVCREQDRLTMLSETPIDLLRATGSVYDEYIYAWVDTLQTYWLERPGLGEKLRAAIEGTAPENARIAPPDLMLKVLYPPINLFYRFIEEQHEEFNDALAQALELHQNYWGDEESMRNQDRTAFIALGLLAMTCLAHDAEFPVEVESEYLPKHLIRRSWLGEFPT